MLRFLKKEILMRQNKPFSVLQEKMQHYSDCTFILVREQLALLPT